MKRIAVIGSSGGHLFVLGGKDPKGLLEEIIRQADAAGFQISHVAFVAASTSMDQITEKTTASLWTLTPNGLSAGEMVSLEEVNAAAAIESGKIAEAVRKGELDGLILVSTDPKGINKELIAAGAVQKVRDSPFLS